MKRNSKRFLFRSLPLLVLALCLCLADLSPAASAVTQADIDALKGDAKGLAQEKKNIHRRKGIQGPLDKRIKNTTAKLINIKTCMSLPAWQYRI